MFTLEINILSFKPAIHNNKQQHQRQQKKELKEENTNKTECNTALDKNEIHTYIKSHNCNKISNRNRVVNTERRAKRMAGKMGEGEINYFSNFEQVQRNALCWKEAKKKDTKILCRGEYNRKVATTTLLCHKITSSLYNLQHK